MRCDKRADNFETNLFSSFIKKKKDIDFIENLYILFKY